MISTSDKRWMKVAMQQAWMAPHDKWRVGAALVRGGSLLSIGYNRYRNDPSMVDIPGVSYHAETVAVRRAGDPRGATIYIARVTRSGLMGMAKPCLRCQRFLLENGIRDIVYSTDDGFAKERAQYGLLEYGP